MQLPTASPRLRPIAGRRVVAALIGLSMSFAAAAAIAPPKAEAALAYGPYTCKPGYVWREAFTNDKVCVTPADRDAVRSENANAWWRTSSSGTPRWCVSGYVWREARPSDYVCVPPAARDRERSNNASAVQRLEDPSATPWGGMSFRTQYTQTGYYVYTSGYGASPYGKVSFWHVTTTSTRWGAQVISSRYADASGRLGDGYIGHLPCNFYATAPTVIVVNDERSGTVTTAGSTWAVRHCG
jgi:hypothetical protein